jgi:hypothetical protein
METWWLSIPYIILAVLAGVRFYLLSALPTPPAGRICVQEHLSKHKSIKWYKWCLRELKDLAVTGMLTLLASAWLSGLIPWFSLAILAVLAALLLVKSAVLLVLWLMCAGCWLPDWLCSLAAAALLPPAEPAPGLRAACWGGAFVLAGAAALTAWAQTGDLLLLLPSFLLLTLGFVSLLRGVFPEKSGEESNNPKDAG